jgi:hypothetical protein
MVQTNFQIILSVWNTWALETLEYDVSNFVPDTDSEASPLM